MIGQRHREDVAIGHNSEGVPALQYSLDELLFLHGIAEKMGKLDMLVEQVKLYEEVLLTGKFNEQGMKSDAYVQLAEDARDRARRLVDARYPVPARRGKVGVHFGTR